MNATTFPTNPSPAHASRYTIHADNGAMLGSFYLLKDAPLALAAAGQRASYITHPAWCTPVHTIPPTNAYGRNTNPRKYPPMVCIAHLWGGGWSASINWFADPFQAPHDACALGRILDSHNPSRVRNTPTAHDLPAGPLRGAAPMEPIDSLR